MKELRKRDFFEFLRSFEHKLKVRDTLFSTPSPRENYINLLKVQNTIYVSVTLLFFMSLWEETMKGLLMFSVFFSFFLSMGGWKLGSFCWWQKKKKVSAVNIKEMRIKNDIEFKKYQFIPLEWKYEEKYSESKFFRKQLFFIQGFLLK